MLHTGMSGPDIYRQEETVLLKGESKTGGMKGVPEIPWDRIRDVFTTLARPGADPVDSKAATGHFVMCEPSRQQPVCLRYTMSVLQNLL